MNPKKLLARGFVRFSSGWYVKLYKKGDTQHGVAVLMTEHGPSILQAAESISQQEPIVIAGALEELAEVGASLEDEYEEVEDIELEADDLFDESMRELEEEDEDDWEDDWEDLEEDEEEAEDDWELLDDPLEYSAGVGARGRGRKRRKARRTKRKGRRTKRRAKVQKRRDTSGFRKKVQKAAGRLARGKVMKKLRAAKVKILQSPLADAATTMAAKALQAYGVPPQVTKMALNTAREAGIDRAKAGGYAGMIQRATKQGAKRGTLAREALRRQLESTAKGVAKTFGGGGMSDAVQSFIDSSGGRKRLRALKSANRERAVLRAALRT